MAASCTEEQPSAGTEGIGAIKEGLLEAFGHTNGRQGQSLSLIGKTEHNVIRIRVQ